MYPVHGLTHRTRKAHLDHHISLILCVQEHMCKDSFAPNLSDVETLEAEIIAQWYSQRASDEPLRKSRRLLALLVPKLPHPSVNTPRTNYLHHRHPAFRDHLRPWKDFKTVLGFHDMAVVCHRNNTRGQFTGIHIAELCWDNLSASRRRQS
jgi:hypothetical protein